MGDSVKRRLCGVEATISLLQEMSAGPGPWQVSSLVRCLGIPRSSIYRLLKPLEKEGLVRLESGTVYFGPAIDRILDHFIARTDTQERRRRLRLPALPRHVGKDPARSDRPERLALSAPLVKRSPRVYRIGFSNGSIGNPWRTALIHSVEAGAANQSKRLRELSVTHADDDPARQANDIEEMIDRGINGLIISATSNQLDLAPIRRALNASIPVVFLDRGLRTYLKGTSLVCGRDDAIGRKTARWICEHLGGRGRVLMLSGDRMTIPAQARAAAAFRVFSSSPEIEVVEHVWTGWQLEIARTATEKTIGRYGGGIDAVWCDSGMCTVGSMSAFAAAGFKKDDFPLHTGGDINHVYKMAVRLGVPLAAMDYPPSMGVHAIEALLEMLRGQWVPQVIPVDSHIIVSRGWETQSTRADLSVEDHARPGQPDELILASGLGQHYSPRTFRVRYPGNRYNRSSAPSSRWPKQGRKEFRHATE